MDLEEDPWGTVSPINEAQPKTGWDRTTSEPQITKPYSSKSLAEEAKKRVSDYYTGVNIFSNAGAAPDISDADNREEVAISTVESVWDPAVTMMENSNGTEGVRSLAHFQATDSPQYGLSGLEIWFENVRKTYFPLAEDIVTVEEIPEREGLVFKHTNYLVKHLVELPNTDASDDKCVIRRYSDFDWLQDVLLKKYPFRMIPELPPKKINSQNADSTFLTKRRKGLSRFINLVMKHPVLRTDDLVLTFLTVPTDLSGWRRQANYDTSDEFTDRRISADFMKLWKKEYSEQWNTADRNIDSTLELWVKVTVLVERYEKRMRQVAHERKLMGKIMGEFPEKTKILYPQSESTVSHINEGIHSIMKHVNLCAEVIEKENEEVDTSLSVRFKGFIDVLVAFKGLSERYKMMAGNNIPQVQRRIEINQEKLDTMNANPDVKGVEFDRIKNNVIRDKKSVLDQMNRSWLIRECILEEFTIFQETQFMITDCLQRWIDLNLRYTNEHVDNWEKICRRLSDMPLSRH